MGVAFHVEIAELRNSASWGFPVLAWRDTICLEMWRMFKIAVLTFDPETKALLTRLLDFLERNDQAVVDALEAKVADLTGRLKVSQTSLQGDIR